MRRLERHCIAKFDSGTMKLNLEDAGYDTKNASPVQGCCMGFAVWGGLGCLGVVGGFYFTVGKVLRVNCFYLGVEPFGVICCGGVGGGCDYSVGY